MKRNINTNSNYWIGNLTGSLDDAWWRDEEVTKKKGKDLIALAGYRKAISNFVGIVTQRTDIPVVYNSKDESYTDGKKVYLSARMNDKNFDPSVGLALHEGSHIVHTDFDILKDFKYKIGEMLNIDVNRLSWEERKVFFQKVSRIKDLLNYVEDRRIDYIVFTSAPGYKNYYHQMYKKYFEFKVINKALKSDEYRDASEYESYEFRIINFLNPNTDLDALPGLKEIYRTIDFKNISRLKNTQDALKVALEIYSIIEANLLPKPELPIPDENTEGQDAQNSDEDGDDSDGKSSTSTIQSSSEDSSDSPSDQIDNTQNEKSSKGIELSDKDKKSLQKAFTNQRAFNNGNVKKSNLTKKDKDTLKAVEDSKAFTAKVGTTEYNKTNCIVVPRITKSMLPKGYTNKAYEFLSWSEDRHLNEAILDGILLGKRLGKKLQVRNEERSTKWTRQDSGKIDKRIIAELGFDNSNVFSQTSVTRYEDAFIHISVDASGSMSGTNWNNSMKTAAAIAQAASMCGNIHVQISIRATQRTGKDLSPLIAIIYDSKVNKIVHIKQIWKFLTTNSTTPEGLCFEAIANQILKDANGRDAYFLNLSDGQPWFNCDSFSYGGYEALKHTRNQVDKFRKAGINILSFFITDSDYGRDCLPDFKKMYGRDSVNIDPTSLTSLAKVLNSKFLAN